MPKAPDIEIVGVARNAHYNSLQEEIPPVAYLPYTQRSAGLGGVFFELRTAGDPLTLARRVRQIVTRPTADSADGDEHAGAADRSDDLRRSARSRICAPVSRSWRW